MMDDTRLKRWCSHLDDLRTEIAAMEAEGPPARVDMSAAHEAINAAILALQHAGSPQETSRYRLIRTLLGAARSVVHDMDTDRTPVESSRLRQIRQYCDNSLATLGWFDQPYADDVRGA